MADIWRKWRIYGEKTRVETRVEMPVETSVKTPEQIIQMLRKSPEMTLSDIGAAIGKHPSTIERAVSKLVEEGRLIHVGPRKGGHWEVVS